MRYPITNQLSLLLILPAVLSSVSHQEPLVLEERQLHQLQGQFFMADRAVGKEEHELSESETNVTAQLGGSVFLHCPVANSGDRAISWIRLKDWHILTNGVVTYTSDKRFQILHKEGSYNWILQIRYVQERDAGDYECQVSTTTGSLSRRVHLKVVTPEAFILGGDQYHTDQGSQISLICVIEKAPSPPQYVFWYHNGRMVNYDSDRGVKVRTWTKPGRITATTNLSDSPSEITTILEDGEVGEKSTKSRLTIAKAAPEDSGNYTCEPSNAVPASIQVFVAMQRVDKTEALHKKSLSSSSSSSSSQTINPVGHTSGASSAGGSVFAQTSKFPFLSNLPIITLIATSLNCFWIR